MAVLLYRIGAFAARRHFLVMGVWLLVIVAAVLGAITFPGKGSPSVEIPGTQSQTAIDLLNSRFPAANGGSSKVIYFAPAGQSIRSFESQISGVAARMKSLPNEANVVDPAGVLVPAALSSGWFQTLSMILPLSAAVRGMQGLLTGAGSAGGAALGGALVVLVVVTALGVALTLVAISRRRGVTSLS